MKFEHEWVSFIDKRQLVGEATMNDGIQGSDDVKS